MPGNALELHERAFIESFVSSRWLARYRATRQLVREDICHRLASRLNADRCMRHDKKPAIAELRAAIEPHCRSSSVVMISVNSDLDGVEWPLEKLFAGDHPVCWPRGIMEEDTIVSIDPGELALLYPESPGPMFVCVKAPVARSRIARDLGILTGH